MSTSAKSDRASPFRGDGYERSFVWLVWAAMTAALLLWIGKYGRGLPLCDDWAFLDGFSAPTLSFGWLCEQAGDSRFFLGKFLIWVLWHASGGDFRAGMLFGGACQSVTAAGMIAVARRLRGKTEYSDAYFPILLLNWSITASLSWFMLVGMFAGMFLFYNVFLLLVAGGRRPAYLLPAAGLSLVLLPLAGSLGVLFVPCLLLGMLWMVLAERPGPQAPSRTASLCVIAASIAAMALTALYFVGFNSSGLAVGRQGSVTEMLLRVFECAGKGLGWLRYPQWLARWLPGAAAAVVTAAAFCLPSARAAESRWRRLLTLLLAAGATWAFPALVGSSRPGVDGTPWYIVMAAPVWCLAYLVWCIESGGPSRFAQMALFAVACSLAVHQLAEGTDWGMERSEAAEAFERDVAAGIPVTGLVARHADSWAWNRTETLMAQGLLALRDREIQPFAAIADDPPWRSESVPMERIQPAPAGAATPYPWTGDMRVNAYHSFAHPRFVTAIRLMIDGSSSSHPGVWRRRTFRVVWWCEAGPPGWPGLGSVSCERILAPEGGPITFWVDQPIRGFCVQAVDEDFPPFQAVVLTQANDTRPADD